MPLITSGNSNADYIVYNINEINKITPKNITPKPYFK